MLDLNLRSRAERLAIARSIQDALNPTLPAKLSYLREGIAAGFDFAKDASLVAALDAGDVFAPDDFSLPRFTERLAELSGDRLMAEAATLAIDGVTLNIDVERYSEARQRHDRFDDTAFRVSVQAAGLLPSARAEIPVFVLPAAFGTSDNGPRIRLASDHEFKFAGDYPISVQRNGPELLTAKLVDGAWRGAMYVDLRREGADYQRAIGSVKAALARAITPAIDPWVRCWIFRPDGYTDRVWRVHLSLGAAARATLGNSRLAFDIPQHAQRFFRLDPGFLFDLNPAKSVFQGQFVDGRWSSNMQSNGVSEAENQVPIAALRAMLIRNVNLALGRQ